MIDEVTARLLEAIGRGDRYDPIVLRFLLRRFRATGREHAFRTEAAGLFGQKR